VPSSGSPLRISIAGSKCSVVWKVGEIQPQIAHALNFSVKTQECLEFDVHVTVHRDQFLKRKPTRYINFSNLFLESNSTCFGQFLCPSSAVFHCTHSNGVCHTGLLTACSQAVSKPV